MNDKQMDIYVCDKRKTKFMEAIGGFKPGRDVVISHIFEGDLETKTNKNIIMESIERSKSDKNIWFPAIKYCGVLYVAPGVTQLVTSEGALVVRVYNKNNELINCEGVEG